MLNKEKKPVGTDEIVVGKSKPAPAEPAEDEAMDVAGEGKAAAFRSLLAAIKGNDEAAGVQALTDFVASCGGEDY